MTRNSRHWLSDKNFAKAGIIQDALGITYTEMEEDLKDMIKAELLNPPDLRELPDGPVDVLVHATQIKKVDSKAVPELILRQLRLGQRYLVNSKGFKDNKELALVVHSIMRDVQGLITKKTGTAFGGLRFVAGVGGARSYTKQSLRLTATISEADFKVENAMAGVASVVDYASVLEIKGFTANTAMKTVYRKYKRKYQTSMNIVLRFYPTDKLGRANTGRKGYKGTPTGGVYAVPVILVSQLGVVIEQGRGHRYRRVRPNEKADQGWKFPWSKIRTGMNTRRP